MSENTDGEWSVNRHGPRCQPTKPSQPFTAPEVRPATICRLKNRYMMPSFFALKSLIRAWVIATVASPLSTRNVIVVPLPPLLDPSDPALQAVRASEATATPVTIAQERRLLASFIASSRGDIGWVGWDVRAQR